MATAGPERSSAALPWLLILGTTAVWCLLPWPIFGAWILLYLLGWSTLQVVLRGGLSRRWSLALGLGLALGAGRLPVVFPRLLELEGLTGLGHVLGDRLSLDQEVVWRPSVIRDDRPQRFFLTAPAPIQQVRVALGRGWIPARGLGRGLFMVDYDPRRDGEPKEEEGRGPLRVELDGVARSLEVERVRATAHPQAIFARDDGAWCTSFDTDTLFHATPTGLVSLSVGDGPLALGEWSGRLAVATRYAGVIELRGLSDGALTGSIAVGAEVVALAASASLLAIGRGGAQPGLELWADSPRRRLLAIATDEPPDRLVVSPEGRWLAWTLRGPHSLHLWARGEDGSFAPVRRPLTFGRPVSAMAINEARRGLALALAGDPADGAGGNHAIDDQLVELDLDHGLVRARLSTRADDERGAVAGVAPRGLAASPDGYVVTFSGSDDLGWWTPGEGLRRGPSPVPRPIGVAYGGEALFVTSPAAAQLAVPEAWGGVLRLGGNEGAPGAARRQGELDFYESTLAGLSCESCHLDGDSDRALHDIGHGTPRPTLSVLGIAGTSPYLRGASYPTLASLDTFAHGVLGGYRREREDRAAALAEFLESLVPEAAPARWSSEADAGVRAFFAAGCDTCHPPPGFTDLSQVASGVLFPDRADRLEALDTPSLRSVGATSPYLYDGRAMTLESVFEVHDPSGTHGGFQQLAKSDRRALFTFLRAL